MFFFQCCAENHGAECDPALLWQRSDDGKHNFSADEENGRIVCALGVVETLQVEYTYSDGQNEEQPNFKSVRK